MRSLILNADDFGLDEDTYATTVSCFEAGLLMSATIMTGCAASQLAFDFARKHRGRFSFGLHFNIVDGHRGVDPERSSLCVAPGVFRASDAQRLRAITGWLREEDIRKEFRHQLTQLLDHDIEVTHIDSHGHIHKYPVILRAIRQEMERAGILWVRRPQNLFLRADRRIVNRRRAAMNGYFARNFSGMMQTDYYGAVDQGDRHWAARLPDMLPEGVTEISVHPGSRESWRRNEAAPLVAPGELAAALARGGIALTRYCA